jgi:coronin-7
LYIQANSKFIAVPIAGPGGRVGIINAEKPGRLPTHILSILCNSEVTNFKFDPFNESILVTGKFVYLSYSRDKSRGAN